MSNVNDIPRYAKKGLYKMKKINNSLDNTCSCYSQQNKDVSKSGYCYSSYARNQMKCDSYPEGFITLEYAEKNCGYNDSDSNIKASQSIIIII